MEKESHGKRVSMSSYLHSERGVDMQISDLTDIGKVSTDGGKGSSRPLDIGEAR